MKTKTIVAVVGAPIGVALIIIMFTVIISKESDVPDPVSPPGGLHIPLSDVPSRYTIRYSGFLYEGFPNDEMIVYRDGEKFRQDFLKNGALQHRTYFLGGDRGETHVCGLSTVEPKFYCNVSFGDGDSASQLPNPLSESKGEPEHWDLIVRRESLPDELILGVTAKCTRFSGRTVVGPAEDEYCMHPEFNNLVLRRNGMKAVSLSFIPIPLGMFEIPKL